MKPLNLALAALAIAWGISARADSTVVFNEIMYHPATNEAQMEWVELHNQMSVDMDISHWSLAKRNPNGATASYGDVLVLPTDHLLQGTNVLAAEVHQARSIVAYPKAVLNSAPVAYWRLGESATPVVSADGGSQSLRFSADTAAARFYRLAQNP